MTVFAEFAACCLIGYLLGNLSPSYVLGKRKGYDVRKDGSGNAGATNTFILMGAKAFFLTTFADILKAYAAYKLCEVFFRDIPFAGVLGGTACIIGHIYPALMGFRIRSVSPPTKLLNAPCMDSETATPAEATKAESALVLMPR